MDATEKLEVREGTTAEISMTLYGNDTAINLTSVDHVELNLRDSKNKIYRFSSDDASPQVRIITAASGIVGYTPISTDLLAARSPYKGYWWVWASSVSKYACPEESEFEITVRSEY